MTACACRGIDEAPGCHHGALHWEAIRSTTGRGRRIIYRRLTSDSNRRQASIGAVSRHAEGVRALLYDWRAGSPGRTELGFFPTERRAMRAVEDAAGVRVE